MKVIIAGSRSIADYDSLTNAVCQSRFKPTEIVSGAATGVDKLGEKWAALHEVPVKLFMPHWGEHGKQAGILRNIAMAEYADALIALWDGNSSGTAHMITCAVRRRLKVYVVTL